MPDQPPIGSSINSAFNFHSYKIDHINFRTKQNLAVLGLNKPPDDSQWQFNVAIRQPLFFRIPKFYVCGINIVIFLPDPDNKTEERKPENSLVSLELGVAGIFSVEKERIDASIEELITKEQMPAILFPFLRSAIAQILSNAGFGHVLIPLINVPSLAKDSLKDMQIEVR